MISKQKIKSFLKIIIKKSFLIYSIFILPGSFILLIYFKNKHALSKNKKLKYYSLRISRKYFGHQAIEPAIASSIMSNNKNLIFIFSIKEKKIEGNKKLNYLIKNSFTFSSDFYLSLIEHIYNYSFKYLQLIIYKFYSPLIPKNDNHREMQYWPELASDKNSLWRKNAMQIIKENKDIKYKNCIFIALRSEHFHKFSKNVDPQPYRNASIQDWFHLLNTCEELKTQKKIICYCNKYFEKIISEKYKNNPYILTIRQEENDVFDYFEPTNLLINNGNGIGAAAFSIGLKTLFIQHSPWHVWFTSHGNSLMLPIEYRKKNVIKKDLEYNFELAFSPVDEVPFSFEKNFQSQNIELQSIKDINKLVLRDTLLDALNLDIIKQKKRSEFYKGCEINYGSNLEKLFWIRYIEHLPLKIRYWHKKINMNISKSFLHNFS